ncbi:histidine phosphatase family protein [Ruminococcus sp. OA3]|uniref:histidine phosphatase family protein n=1 Tax=Ruminococcus sp. OA3 TaxID=2914164 RepID=UPI001F059443|nr:histidine phosphatase family protein [Ruminococcus sp. OA3]MCH1983634.1 histidine phosphatase family protein [Ruminococcus sp. OA3]
MRLYLIRHSITYGNTLGRYIGTTDEPLCQEGIELLQKKIYPGADAVYASPLKRCTQTAEIIYPEKPIHIIEDLAECDFGIFENKNYLELDGNEDYQRWIDSGGTLPFPCGESQETFRSRCLRGFERVAADCIREEKRSAALVVHGGTIMSILDGLAVPHEDFYFWQVKNARGYEIELDEQQWNKGKREVSVCGKLKVLTADALKQL